MKHLLMIHWGRSGSTVVGGMLRQHPALQWDGEILRGRMLLGGHKEEITDYNRSRFFPHNPVGWVRHKLRTRQKPRHGFEIKPWHVRQNGITYPGFLANVLRMGYDGFILLVRRNYLRLTISERVAGQGGPYHVRANETVEPRPIRIACTQEHERKALLAKFADLDREERRFRRLLRGRQLLELEYEKDIRDDPRVAYRKILAFAGLPPASAEVRLGRTNPFSLAEMVENLDEVVACLAGTPYAWMTDPEA